MTELQSSHPALALILSLCLFALGVVGVGTLGYFFIWWPLRNAVLRAWHEHLRRAAARAALDNDPNATEVIPRYRHRK